MSVEFTLDGRLAVAPREGVSLLEALREDLGVRSPKDGCSPQGQCGCCTVLVDGAPRVACVTPVRRVAGRSVTTADGLDPDVKDRLVRAFVAHGASQCGFCTPGILCRLAAVASPATPAQVETALLAHLCRCTGWRTILEAACDVDAGSETDPSRASLRATLEGGVAQSVGQDVVLGRGGFADDTAPGGCLVAVPAGPGGWATGETLAEARSAAGKVQGRRSGREIRHPVELPPGEWDLTLQTAYVEPGYLEPDASWCLPGGEPASPVANGGAFGGKLASVAPAAARELAERFGRPVRVVFSREDVVRLGPKRPPIAAGIHLDGAGVVRVATAAGIAAAIRSGAPGVTVEEVQVEGPPLSASIRGAGWAEGVILVAAAQALREGRAGSGEASANVQGPGGGRAEAAVGVDGSSRPARVTVTVDAGDPLDPVVLRSYVTGAAHMALGWVGNEAIAVDDEGLPEDLTIRSFGILRARETPPIEVVVTDSHGPPVPVSAVAGAAVAAAYWIAVGLPPRWPVLRT